ncbi:MAG: M23 family metallopeptidase [Desulfobulbaceae bacterium]|nr:M23 family metallopeptidase [Desulfobulbaceae bacterium]HIJ90354.1 M23 family metallopeptidase [Deltaproteobacteria bacterium]
MDKKIHFIVTGERGVIRSFAISRNAIRIALGVCCFLVLGSGVGWFFSGQNFAMHRQMAEMQQQLTSTIALNASMQERTTKQEHEQQAQLNAALADLKHKSQVIESILASVGVKLEVHESRKGAGGPFTRLPQDSYEGLTLKVDHYLDTIQSVPLGAPVRGTITSQFGGRLDPINGEPAFHSGVDIKNNPGTKIVAPADGVVVTNGYDSGHGHFVEIDHGNRFQTSYLHLQQDFVKQGDTVARGQVIGLVGNSGRSTGAHLHYEIKYRNKLLDPVKFIQVNSRTAALSSKQVAARTR